MLRGVTHAIPPELSSTPFTLATAEASGVTRKVLRGSRFRRPYRGVYVPSTLPDSPLVRARAALLAAPDDAWVSHVTAIALRGLVVSAPYPIHLSTCHPHQREIRGVVVHRRLWRPRLDDAAGVPLASPERSWVESCQLLGFINRVVVVDWLLRRHTNRTVLEHYLTHTHIGGVRRARVAFTFGRDRVDSPKETVLRLCLRFARLPEPAVNVVVGDPMDPVGRPDLPYLQYQVGVEYDGEYHFADLKQRQRDNIRREAFENVGWRLVIITKQDMLRPREVVWRVYRALRERGYQGSPPAFDDVWCRWFERVPRTFA
jgi:very-short-patch-repair endonuclease